MNDIDADEPRRLVVAYDIPSDRTRAAVAKCLKGFGLRVQLSVFECCLSARETRRLTKALSQMIDPEADVVQVFECSRSAPRMPFVDRPSAYWLC